jgi:SAM-dependent methyltransferase
VNTTAPAATPAAWQLEMLRFSLKKQQKLDLLERMLERPVAADDRCLLVTCGDNNGAMNYRFRLIGGSWRWAELEESGIAGIESLLGDPVARAWPDHLPFQSASFARVIVIDVHEHLPDVSALNQEIARVLAPGGQVIVTTPNGNRRLPLATVKRWIGMSEATYGHVVQGYDWRALEAMLVAAGLEPMTRGAYSRFFTELIELLINIAYVKLLGRRARMRVAAGEIAPRSAAQLQAVGSSYRMYRRVFPVLRAFAALDRLIPGRGGYAVAIGARRPSQ